MEEIEDVKIQQNIETNEKLDELVKINEVSLNSQSETNETLKEIQPVLDAILMKLDEKPEKEEVEKMELVGAELVTIKGQKGDKGDKGDTPTKEELTEIIIPLIPEPIKGEDGSDYILTEKDKREIAQSIEVPIVEKVIEKTETIIEKPTTIDKTKTVVKEVAQYETAEEIASKINSLDKKIDFKVIKNFPDFQKGGSGLNKVFTDGTTITGNGLADDPLTVIGNGGGVQSVVAGTNVTVDNTDPQNPIVSSTGGGGGGTPGGSDTEIQFNDAGVFGGALKLQYEKSSDTVKLNKIASIDGNLEIVATGSATLDADTIVQRATSQYGVSNNGGTAIQYFDTTNLTADRTSSFPDANVILAASVNNLSADNEGNIVLSASDIPYTGVEANVSDMLDTLYDTKASKQTTASILLNTNTDSSTATGTTTTIQNSKLITPGDILNVSTFSLRVKASAGKTGTAGAIAERIYLNTANNLTGAVLIGQYTADLGTRLTIGIERTFRIRSGFLQYFPSTGATDNVNQTPAWLTTAIDPTNNFYILHTTQAGAGDVHRSTGITIEFLPEV